MLNAVVTGLTLLPNSKSYFRMGYCIGCTQWRMLVNKIYQISTRDGGAEGSRTVDEDL